MLNGVLGFEILVGEFTLKSIKVCNEKPEKQKKKGYTEAFPSLPKKGYLARGDKGVQVGRLQAFLNWYGDYVLERDNSFGPATEKAVKAFQKKEGLEVDGFFGPASLKAAKAVKK
mgnify:CR=1 FL=1